MEPITLKYSENLIRRAIGAFWWRSTGYTFFGAFCVVLTIFVYLLASGARSWWLGIMGSVLVFTAVLATLLYFVHFRSSIARFRRMGSKEAKLEANESRFRISSDIGESELSWSSVTKVWTFQDFLLIFYSSSQFSILPVDEKNMAARAFILERARSHGAVIAE